MGNLNIRVSNEFELQLKKEAKEHGMTLSDYCRKKLSSKTETQVSVKSIESMLIGQRSKEPIGDRLDNFAHQFYLFTENTKSLISMVSEITESGKTTPKVISEIQTRVENIWNFVSVLNQNVESIDNGYKKNSRNLATVDNDILKLSYFVRRMFEELEKNSQKRVQDILREMDMEFINSERPAIFPAPKNWE